MSIFNKAAIEEYERIIKSLSDFEALLIELQEIIRKNNKKASYRKYIVSKSMETAKKLHVDITVYLLACELVLGDEDR